MVVDSVFPYASRICSSNIDSPQGKKMQQDTGKFYGPKMGTPVQ